MKVLHETVIAYWFLSIDNMMNKEMLIGGSGALARRQIWNGRLIPLLPIIAI